MTDSARIQVLAPLIKDRKGRHEKVFEDVRKAGFVRVRVDGEVREVEEDIDLARYESHTIEVVVDRLVIRHFEDAESEDAKSARSRLTDSIETALEMGDGVVIVNDVSDSANSVDKLYSEKLACVYGHVSLPELGPRTFSFNNPHGACPTCQGLGVRLEIDPMLVVPNADLSLAEGAISEDAWPTSSDSTSMTLLLGVARTHKIPTDKPWRYLNEAQQDIILYGRGAEGRRYPITYNSSTGDQRTYNATWE